MRLRPLVVVVAVSAAACAQRESTGAVAAALDEGGAGDAAAPPARCCVSTQADAATLAASIAIEPCWDSNPAGNYARWTCASGACSANGTSCAVGAACTLVDIGVPGVVQECAYPWH